MRVVRPSAILLVVPLFSLPACGGDAKKGEAKKADAKKADAKQDEKGDEKGDEKAAGGAPGSGGFEFQLPAGLSAPPKVPEDNPMSAAKVALGHQLFMDKRLSGDGSRSCYSCHQNQLGNADGRPLALGAGDKPLTRNTPTIWNVGYHATLYWDGRAPSLEKQAVGAIKGGNMGVGADNLEAKAKEIGGLDEYGKAFTEAFGLKEGEAVTMDHIAMALSAYERTLLCGDTAFDTKKMDEAATRGWDLFRGKAACTSCHAGDNFTTGAFFNVGIGFDESGKPTSDAPDIGRGKVTESEGDNYKFRVPTLRNVSKTAPYFHDGSAATLEEAVKYMAGGGNPKAPNVDPLMRDVGLTDAEIADVVAFLKTLDCPGELEVVGDQTVAGIGNEG
jgi:cytochrome c peroxidase